MPEREHVSKYEAVGVRTQTLQPGDRLLLCSDGLHGNTPERSIRRVLAADGIPDEIAREFVALALLCSAPDNIAALVITVGGGRGGPVGQPLPT